MNLIANAVYAMPSGGILSVAVQDIDDRDRSGVVLTVTDTGVGIPAERLPKIFEAFFTTRKAIGTGIGLFIARQFVETHAGKIEVVSNTDAGARGTRMSVFLPVD